MLFLIFVFRVIIFLLSSFFCQMLFLSVRSSDVVFLFSPILASFSSLLSVFLCYAWGSLSFSLAWRIRMQITSGLGYRVCSCFFFLLPPFYCTDVPLVWGRSITHSAPGKKCKGTGNWVETQHSFPVIKQVSFYQTDSVILHVVQLQDGSGVLENRCCTVQNVS